MLPFSAPITRAEVSHRYGKHNIMKALTNFPWRYLRDYSQSWLGHFAVHRQQGLTSQGSSSRRDP